MASKKRGRTWRKRKRGKRERDRRPVYQGEDRELINLQQFMKANDFKGCPLKPAVFPDTGRGVMAARSIKGGEVIIAVPRNILISCRTILSSRLGTELKKWSSTSRFTCAQVLSLFLLLEKNKGKSSFWHPYIRTLPNTFTTPVYFTETELSALSPSLQEKARDLKKELLHAFNDLEPFVSSSLPELDSMFTFDAFRWAWSVLKTRTLYQEDCRSPYLSNREPQTSTLVPMLDLINHSPSAKARFGYNVNTSCYEVRVLEPYRKHDQVFISYGFEENSELMLKFGFYVPRNPKDFIKINLSELLECLPQISDEERKNKVDLLFESGLLSNQTCNWNGISWQVMSVLQVLATNGIDKNSVPSIFPNSNPLSCHFQIARYMMPFRNAALSSEELRALQAARTLLERRLESYETTIEEDEALLREVQSPCMEMAVGSRAEEKRMLRNALNLLKTNQ
ncbi:SET domain-containing protein 4-like isoform X1 [Branchiostoma floridae x Branchiostoma belcheri]